jgi:thiosulfate dehydrogenase
MAMKNASTDDRGYGSLGGLAVFGVVALAAIALAALFIVGAVTSGSAFAHKEKHTEDTLEFFEQAFMEQVIIGDRLFHGDAELEKEMGINLSNTGMACAMCHPFAADTHPHEFPKWQEQMSEFATLRDMTNWCIDKPNEGEMIDVDSDAMKALEAYMYWSNRGSVLDPGRH